VDLSEIEKSWKSEDGSKNRRRESDKKKGVIDLPFYKNVCCLRFIAFNESFILESDGFCIE